MVRRTSWQQRFSSLGMSTSRWRSKGLEALHRLLFLRIDGEQRRQLQRLEDLVKLGIRLAQRQPAARRLHLFAQHEQLGQHGADHEPNIAEVEHELPVTLLFYQVEQLLA